MLKDWEVIDLGPVEPFHPDPTDVSDTGWWNYRVWVLEDGTIKLIDAYSGDQFLIVVSSTEEDVTYYHEGDVRFDPTKIVSTVKWKGVRK